MADAVMTIAVCFLTSEGVVFGADSTATSVSIEADRSHRYHYLHHQQKVFEVGEGSTLGVVYWGLFTFGTKSIRTLVAELSDTYLKTRPKSVRAVADRWADTVNLEYDTARQLHAEKIARFRALDKRKHLQGNRALTVDERSDWLELKTLMDTLESGFFLGGYVLPSREPKAFEIRLLPTEPLPIVRELKNPGFETAGKTEFADRMIDGMDRVTRARIAQYFNSEAAADKAVADLVELAKVRYPVLPIREAVDLVHWLIQSTIKGVKFSDAPQTCGGPIEIGMITSDRKWRWIRHKSFESAINDGVLQ